MPKRRKLNEPAETDAAEGGVATMPPPPEGAVERVEADEEAPAGMKWSESNVQYEPDPALEETIETENKLGAQEESSTFAASSEGEEQEPAGSTPEHTYDVDESGGVSNVRSLPLPLPSTNGKGKRIQIAVVAGRVFNPVKCKFCGKKCPPHPARLKINRPLGAVEHDLCATCDEGFTGLLRELGEGEVTLVIVGPGGAIQTSMVDQLEQDLGDDLDHDEDGEGDHDGPPSEDVAKRIRRIAAELPDRPYDQGAAAFCEGIAVEDNPYAAEPGPLNQDRRTRWDDGWIAAKVDALRAAGETEEADQLAAAAAQDLQAAVQSVTAESEKAQYEAAEAALAAAPDVVSSNEATAANV